MFVGFAILAAFGKWWPGILLAIGIPVSLRNFLTGKVYEGFVSLVIFFGVYLSYYFEFRGRVAAVVIFGLGALYFFLKEFVPPAEPDETEDEMEEDINHEIEEDYQPDDKSKKDK